MSLVSNAFSTSVVAASSSPLATAAAGMTAGQWLNFGASSGTSGLSLLQSGSGGASGIRTPFCSEFVYDDVNKLFYVHSADHNQDANWFRYNEASNSLVLDHTASWMVVNNNGIHGYDHVVNAKGKFYSRKLDEEFLRRWDGPGLTTWTSSSTIAGPGGNISAAGHCYHAGLNRILVHQIGSNPNGIIVGLDPDSFTTGGTGTWTSYSQALNGTGDPHNFNVYNAISQIAWFGGGNGSTSSWTMGNAGASSITAATQPLPHSTGPSNAGGLALPNPHNGDFTVWYDANNWFDFSAATGRFTQRAPVATAFVSNMASQTDPANVAFMGGVIGCSIPAPYNVFFFWKAWARNTPGEMWLYKPQVSYSTTFALTQNPIVEDSSWVSGSVFSPRTNVQTGSGCAFGTMASHTAPNFEDSAAHRTGFGANHEVTCTIFNNGSLTAGVNSYELEILLRADFNSGHALAYEIDCYWGGGRIDLIRWDGVSGTTATRNAFTPLVSPGPSVALNNGDQVYASIVGTVITVKYKPLGGSFSTIITHDTAGDSTRYSTGNPGIGFWNETGSASGQPRLAWADFAANSL